MTKILHIYKKHFDTRRVIYQLASKLSPSGIDITTWTNFELIVDPEAAPINSDNNVASLSGIIIDAISGRVGFVPTGLVPVGDYFYNARGIDENGERITFAEGKLNISQDI